MISRSARILEFLKDNPNSNVHVIHAHLISINQYCTINNIYTCMSNLDKKGLITKREAVVTYSAK